MISLAFFREFFGIPRNQKMQWAVIVEEDKKGQIACRFGILLCGTSKTIDVMNRKFIQSELLLPVKRMTYPAKKKVYGRYVQLDTIDAKPCRSVCLCKSTLYAEYFMAHYSPELMEAFVF